MGTVFFYGLAPLLVGAGFWEMFNYGPDQRIVGGDAYNFIIIGVRGVGLIISGLVSAVIGGTLLVLERLSALQQELIAISELRGNVKHWIDEYRDHCMVANQKAKD